SLSWRNTGELWVIISNATDAAAAHVNVQLGGGHAVWPKAIVEPRIVNARRAAYFIASFLLRVEVPKDLSILRRRWIRSHRTSFCRSHHADGGRRSAFRSEWGVGRKAFGGFGSRRGGRARMRRENREGLPGGDTCPELRHVQGGLRFPPTRPRLQRTRSSFSVGTQHLRPLRAPGDLKLCSVSFIAILRS